MNVALFSGLFFALCACAQSYVVKEKNGANNSNVDAVFHKNMNQNQHQNQRADQSQNQGQTNKNHEQANQKYSPVKNDYRKHLTNTNTYKRFEVRQRVSSDDDLKREIPASVNEIREKYRGPSGGSFYPKQELISIAPPYSASNPRSNPGKVESVILSVDTGAMNNQKAKQEPDGVDRIMQALGELTMNKNPNGVMYRAQKEYNLKPSLVRFRASDQPSLKLDITSSSIIKAIGALLTTPTARRYAEIIGQRAAVVFKALIEQFPELKKIKLEQLLGELNYHNHGNLPVFMQK